MFVSLSHASRQKSRPAKIVLSGNEFAAIAILLEIIVIVAMSLNTGVLYHAVAYNYAGPILDILYVGMLIAFFYSLPSLFHAHDEPWRSLPGERGLTHVFGAWNFAFFCIAVLGFLTKNMETHSRGWLVILYISGLCSVVSFEVAMAACRGMAIRSGRLTTRRLLAIGAKKNVQRFLANQSLSASGIKVVPSIYMPEGDLSRDEASATIRNAMASARAHHVTDIVVLTDWASASYFTKVAEEFIDVPVTVHLGGLGAVEKFEPLGVARLGSAVTVVLRREPLSGLKAFYKRAFDVGASSVALLALAPVFATIAILIKYDSPGPIFFRQRRRGYNHKEFRMWKFRTMTTTDDGDNIVQASKDDARITRVGAFLRKVNLDELPQLINVLKGDMSLVGPRPHAVAHDGYYERIIKRYGRRLNVKPGITGWAQINGYRGPTNKRGDMQARLAHDLYYIENCNVALDIFILVMTVLSQKAYRNAF